jgi:hypothetical protein
MPKDYREKPFKECPLSEPGKELEALNQTIDTIGCFGVHDLVMRDAIEYEIDRRGYDIVPSAKFTLVKR